MKNNAVKTKKYFTGAQARRKTIKSHAHTSVPRVRLLTFTNLTRIGKEKKTNSGFKAKLLHLALKFLYAPCYKQCCS
jgi:hypothetical protein